MNFKNTLKTSLIAVVMSSSAIYANGGTVDNNIGGGLVANAPIVVADAATDSGALGGVGLSVAFAISKSGGSAGPGSDTGGSDSSEK